MADVVAPATPAVDSNTVPIYDISGPEPVLGNIAHEEVQDALASGKYSLPQGHQVHVVDPDGQLGTIDAAEAPEALKNGYQYATPKMQREIKYSGAGQGAKAFLEGAGEGVAGPLAPMAEKALGVKEEDIRGRREERGGMHGLGQAVGLGAGLLTGTGEAAVMTKAGELATEAVGLGNVAKDASYAAKVGSEAVKQAAEMAVLQGSDEVAKQVLHDPDASAQSAIANIGLSAAIGGAGGALIQGAVAPLWKATAGPKVEALLNGLRGAADGTGGLKLPEGLQESFTHLGIEPHPVLQAALSGDENSLIRAQELYRAQNPEFMRILNELPEQVRAKVGESLGVPLEEAAVFSNSESGNAVRDRFIKKVDEEYGPLAERLKKRNEEAATIAVPDDDRLHLGSQIMERAIGPEVGTDSPLYKEYEHYAQRVLAKDDIRGLDRLSTELYDKATSLSTDKPLKNSLMDIRRMINDFKEIHISRQAQDIGESMVDSNILKQAERAKETAQVGSFGRKVYEESKEAATSAIKEAREEGKKIGAGVLNERAEVNRNYREYAKKLDDLMDHLGVGDFKGTETLKAKLASLSPEQVIAKFSTKGDLEAASFLQKNFPEIGEMVRQHEAKKFLSPSIHNNMGELVVDVKNLAKRTENLRKGSPEFASYVLRNGAEKTIDSAKNISDAISKIKNIKDSGTPAGIGKIFKHFGGSALAAVSFLMGHNPISGALIGEAAQRIGKDSPEAIKLALLRFMGSSQPVKAEGFKAMVDFLHNTYKGENLLSKASKALFKAGAQVVPSHLMPDDKDRAKLDKAVAAVQENPKKLEHGLDSDVGHYLPEHQTALAQTSATAVRYLSNLKPQPYKPGPLDKEIQPSTQQIARYNRALNIAQQPAIVLQHIKDGTLQSTDIQDLQNMYPALYKTMAQKMSNDMISHKSEDGVIPYKTRMGISLFLGQPMDVSMQPSSIQAAQPKPKQQPQQGGGMAPKKSTAPLNKGPKTYQTPGQAAESDRSGRD